MHYHITKLPGLMLAQGKIPFSVKLKITEEPDVVIDDDGSVLFFLPDRPQCQISCSRKVFLHLCQHGTALYEDSGGFAGGLIIYHPFRPSLSMMVPKAVYNSCRTKGLSTLRRHDETLLNSRITESAQLHNIDPELRDTLTKQALEGLNSLLESIENEIPAYQIGAILRMINSTA